MIVEEEGFSMVQLLVDAPIAGGIVDACRGRFGGDADMAVDLTVGIGKTPVIDVVLAKEEDIIPRIGRYAPSIGSVRPRPADVGMGEGRTVMV